jgi:hypothetical protein
MAPRYRTQVASNSFVGRCETLVNLCGHTEAQGGRVIGAFALTGKPYLAKFALSQERLASLR